MYKSTYCILLTSGLLSACMQQIGSYKSAEDSGLVSVRPYPHPMVFAKFWVKALQQWTIWIIQLFR